MAILDVEDFYGTFSVMVFGRVYEQIRGRLEEDKIIVINGKLSIRVGMSPIIVATTIDFIGDGENYTVQEQKLVIGETEKTSRQTLYLQFDINNTKIYNTIDEILSSYKGNCPVKIQWDKKLYSVNKRVDLCETLESELKVMLGENNIKII